MTAQVIDRTELTVLEDRLRRARARVDSSSPGGPEYDAAMAALEELESLIPTVTRGSRGGPADAAHAYSARSLAAS